LNFLSTDYVYGDHHWLIGFTVYLGLQVQLKGLNQKQGASYS